MEYVSVLAVIFMVFIFIAAGAGCCVAFRKVKEMYSQNGFKSIRKIIIVSVVVLLTLFLAIGVYYNISHKHWIEATRELKENFPEINKIEFNKPTPTLNVVFYVDNTVDSERAEEIFFSFLNELDEELLNEIIKNADIYSPTYIWAYFISDSDGNNVIVEFASTSDYINWRCITEGNILYGKEYQSILLQ